MKIYLLNEGRVLHCISDCHDGSASYHSVNIRGGGGGIKWSQFAFIEESLSGQAKSVTSLI